MTVTLSIKLLNLLVDSTISSSSFLNKTFKPIKIGIKPSKPIHCWGIDAKPKAANRLTMVSTLKPKYWPKTISLTLPFQFFTCANRTTKITI